MPSTESMPKAPILVDDESLFRTRFGALPPGVAALGWYRDARGTNHPMLSTSFDAPGDQSRFATFLTILIGVPFAGFAVYVSILIGASSLAPGIAVAATVLVMCWLFAYFIYAMRRSDAVSSTWTLKPDEIAVTIKRGAKTEHLKISYQSTCEILAAAETGRMKTLRHQHFLGSTGLPTDAWLTIRGHVQSSWLQRLLLARKERKALAEGRTPDDDAVAILEQIRSEALPMRYCMEPVALPMARM